MGMETKKTNKERTAVMSCTCQHQAQDALYGKGRRLHNLCGKQQDKYRCTVCKREK